MATNGVTANKGGGSKKMEYAPVNNFDVNEIEPDAPAGEWLASIPRGKIKVQPTKEDKLPMLIVPIRLDKTEEEGEDFERALGTELTAFLVFGGKSPKGARMSKIRIRQVCEAADVDLDVIPKKITDPENDLEPLIHALEGKKFPVWTVIRTRKDTGEQNTEVQFQKPGGLKTTSRDADADDEENEEEETPRRSTKKARR